MQKPAIVRTLGVAVTCAAVLSASALYAVAGTGTAAPGVAPIPGLPAATPPEAVRLAQAAAAAPADVPVSYSTQQADRGKKKFASDCVDCHGEDLRGGLIGGPPLRGNSFEEKYFKGAPASALFAFMSTQMPPDSPGRFSASVYADLMAYILKQNGVQPGAALPSDLDALDHLIMEK